LKLGGQELHHFRSGDLADVIDDRVNAVLSRHRISLLGRLVVGVNLNTRTAKNLGRSVDLVADGLRNLVRLQTNDGADESLDVFLEVPALLGIGHGLFTNAVTLPATVLEHMDNCELVRREGYLLHGMYSDLIAIGAHPVPAGSDPIHVTAGSDGLDA